MEDFCLVHKPEKNREVGFCDLKGWKNVEPPDDLSDHILQSLTCFCNPVVNDYKIWHRVND